MRIALAGVISLIAAACAATVPSPRPLESGFATPTGVADPYGDGKQHLAAGRYELAVKRFAQVLASNGRSLDALNGLGIAYTGLGRFDVAQTYFERALQIAPTNVSTLNNYGWSLVEQGRLREAKPFLELAFRHAEESEVPVVAGNIESIRRARPSALVAALEGDSRPEVQLGPHRLIRVDDNAYRLETSATPARRPDPATAAHEEPSPAKALWQHAILPTELQSGAEGRSAPSVVMEGADRTGHALASAGHSWAAAPERGIPVDPPLRDGPIQLWSEPASEFKAGPLPAGD